MHCGYQRFQSVFTDSQKNIVIYVNVYTAQSLIIYW